MNDYQFEEQHQRLMDSGREEDIRELEHAALVEMQHALVGAVPAIISPTTHRGALG